MKLNDIKKTTITNKTEEKLNVKPKNHGLAYDELTNAVKAGCQPDIAVAFASSRKRARTPDHQVSGEITREMLLPSTGDTETEASKNEETPITVTHGNAMIACETL